MVALRADMDALPVTESPTSLDEGPDPRKDARVRPTVTPRCCSEPRRCSIRRTRTRGTVRLVFQPAEEAARARDACSKTASAARAADRVVLRASTGRTPRPREGSGDRDGTIMAGGSFEITFTGRAVTRLSLTKTSTSWCAAARW